MPDTPLNRALSDIAAASSSSATGDVDDPTLPVAGTALVLRDGDAGLEVLMIQRPDRGSFAGAWVFPGGKVESTDRDGLPDGSTEEDVARRAAVRETLEETGLETEPIATLSLWDPPAGAKPRIRTWFFLAKATGGELSVAADEVVAWEWVRPHDVLERHGRGESALYPPTWVTLHSFGDAPDIAAAVADARFERFSTAARQTAAGLMLLWPDDGEYATDAESGTARHRLEVGTLPWVYTRAD